MVYTKKEGTSAVQKEDCLDVRIMDSIANTYNFTYEARLTSAIDSTR